MKHYGLILAISIALCSHIFLYSLLQLWPAPAPMEKSSIPVTLIVSPDSKATKASTAKQKQSKTSHSPEKVTTRSDSKYNASKIHKPADEAAKHQKESKRRQQRNQPNSLKQIFTSNQKNQPKINALTQDAATIMSAYEQELLRHLLDRDLYTDFHRFMDHASETEISLRLRLVLFSNGAIKSASLVEKSKEVAIEPVALRAAYNASPYPEPPEEDIELNYTYFVSMSYNGKEIN